MTDLTARHPRQYRQPIAGLRVAADSAKTYRDMNRFNGAVFALDVVSNDKRKYPL